jgi:UDP-N-acetylglucosamine/UDP-N-acetylgalactosamine diphosphorylase
MKELLKKQRNTLFYPKDPGPFEPLLTYDSAGNEETAKRGKMLIEQGKVGCLILSGGQASRMGLSQPKGLIPVTPVKGKPLLQLFCEKTNHAGPLAIMTSPLNHAPIAKFFEDNNSFGLDIDLFSQEMLPFLDDRGNWVFEAPGKIASGPDGNGYALKRLVESGIWEKWKQRGIEYVTIIPIDNALADPFDPELVGHHACQGNDLSIKAVLRSDLSEKVGAIGLKNGKIGIVEYSELPPQNEAFILANINLFCFSSSFIEKAAKVELSWHLARKAASILLRTAKGSFQESVMIWKFETFLFDLFPHADKASVIVYPREKVYAPLKNATGDKSLKAVQDILLAQNCETYL